MDFEKQTNTTTTPKPTPKEMAMTIMANMKTRIDLLRSHKALVNRLIQTCQGASKPLFLLKEIETEEALLRRARTDLNLWIQQGGRNEAANPSGFFQASAQAEVLLGEGENIPSGVMQMACGGVSSSRNAEKLSVIHDDINEYSYELLHHDSDHRRMYERFFEEDLEEYLQHCSPEYLTQEILEAQYANGLYGCSEYWCDDPYCVMDGTAVPNV